MMEVLPIDEFHPLANERAFREGAGLEDIHTIVSLGGTTCMHRAAQTFREVRAALGHFLRIIPVTTFEQLILHVRDDAHAAMLIPQLHAMSRGLQRKPHYQRIDSQAFVLPNPGLHVATPIHDHSDRTYLWTLPTLIPLVKERMALSRFESIEPMANTDAAAHYCSRIYGGAFCVTNDKGLETYWLRSVQELRHIDMPWNLYRKRRKE